MRLWELYEQQSTSDSICMVVSVKSSLTMLHSNHSCVLPKLLARWLDGGWPSRNSIFTSTTGLVKRTPRNADALSRYPVLSTKNLTSRELKARNSLRLTQKKFSRLNPSQRMIQSNARNSFPGIYGWI